MSEVIVRVDEAQIERIVTAAVKSVLTASRAAYCNKSEAATYLKISTVTLWKLRKKKILMPVDVAGREMYLRADLDKYAQGIPVKA